MSTTHHARNCFSINKIVFAGLLTIAGSMLAADLKAQPYVDIVNLTLSGSPNTGLFNQNKKDLVLDYHNLSTNIPIRLNQKDDAIIISPFWENWSSKLEDNKRESYYGLALPVTFIKSIPGSKWKLSLTGIIRMNDSTIDKNGQVQIGGACILHYRKNKDLTYKFGLYINDECFGLFVIPLLGLDWKISTRDILFGTLPGKLTYEHKLNKYFYCGANFRAITNSYAKTTGYWRIDENQLGLYLDTYFIKNIVFNIEGGHSLFRKVSTGIEGLAKYNEGVNDNFYLKISLAYRIRFAND